MKYLFRLAAGVCAAVVLSGCDFIVDNRQAAPVIAASSTVEKSSPDTPAEPSRKDIRETEHRSSAASSAAPKTASSAAASKAESHKATSSAASSAVSSAVSSKSAATEKVEISVSSAVQEVRTDVETTSSNAESAAASSAVETESSQSSGNTSSAPVESRAEEQPQSIDIDCLAAALYCADDGSFLYNDRTDAQIAPASLTKLLTAAAALRCLSPDDIVTVGTELDLVAPGSSLCYISQEQQLTVYDLLTGMLLCSGNDGAYTAAVNAARSIYPDEELSDQDAVSRFCGYMNEVAAEIGMADSHFVSPDGWDSPDQFTTAADLIKLAEYALNIPEIRSIVGTYSTDVTFYSGESITWTNTNLLIDPYSMYYNEYAIGMKTGTTSNAGCCLIGAFVKDDKTYISVVTGCNTNDDRYIFTTELWEKYGVY